MKFPSQSDALFARDQLLTGCETMRHYLAALATSGENPSREVHTIRKFGKSLRGGLVLFGLKRSAALEIQSIGRILARSRDSVSRLNTWNKLAWNQDPDAARAILALLHQESAAAAHSPHPAVIQWCSSRVKHTETAVRNLPEQNLRKLAKSGINRLGNQVAKRCHAIDPHNPESFHETRKALKAWAGALRLFPEGRVSPDPKMDKLIELFGDENDLTTLAEWLRQHGFTPHFTPHLWKTISGKQQKIQKRLRKRARSLTIP